MVLFRKYRPQKLSELDSEKVKSEIERIFTSKYNPQALLFAGPKGTGKTSTARIAAKILNCLNRKDAVMVCGACDACRKISRGEHLDVVEIDGASNRGIEEIRDLRDKIRLSPIEGIWKVYIIDEVHMLTNEAFNALLKTLEEPPKNTLFILATTESYKVPQTIISRCVTVDFAKATNEELIKSLKRVALGEKVKYEEDALTLIARASDGSFRDATKMFENALKDGVLTVKAIESLTGAGFAYAVKLIKALSEKDNDEALKITRLLSQNGQDPQMAVKAVLEELHRGLLINFQALQGANLEEIKFWKSFSKEEILKLVRIFSRVYIEQKGAYIPFLPFEAAVIEFCTQ